MKINLLKNLTRAAFVVALLLTGEAWAQTKWSGQYGNEWLVGKYGQEWLRIGVKDKGIHKVSLPSNFQNKQTNLRLYHRGLEVPLISATSTQIEFYGIPNDGSSDVWLYRPVLTERSNPYFSWFSDESSYFLTVSPEVTDIVDVQSYIVPTGTSEPYHIQRDVKVYTNEYTHDESKNIQYFGLDQSYYDQTKSMSSVYVWKRTNNNRDPRFPFPFKLKNLVIDNGRKPIIDVMYNGRTFTNSLVQASIGKNIGELRNYASIEDFTGFFPYRKEYTIEEASDLNAEDLNGERSGHLQLESTKITSTTSTTGAFSVNFIRLIYPQELDMTGVGSATFNLLPSVNATTRVIVTNVPVGTRIYDVTNSERPIQITGVYNAGTIDVMVNRIPNQELNLFLTSDVKTVAGDKVESVEFTEYSPSSSDYLIITNSILWDAAKLYEAYRKSAEGGGFNTLAVKIKDIYNQFNYGEPSPIAIRRFVDYMVRRAPREKHNLLLIGTSTSFPPKMMLNRELKDEVPTIGYPGSDILLVEGLSEGYEEVPSIPVGRISATTSSQVESYLNKVIYYEANDLNQGYRKKVLHISGGLNNTENSDFAGYLSGYNKYIQSPTSAFGGSIVAKVKADGDVAYPSSNLNISTNINDGVGFTAYYGHGNPIYTDNNLGYATDTDRGYNNLNKYPLMYFNGCGVGNIFSGRSTPFPDPLPDHSSQMPLSTDWVLANQKGAIAVLANSYYAYVESSKFFIGALYKSLFKTDSNRKSLGKVQQEAMKLIMDGYVGARVMVNSYDISNNHQTLLQGDPALKVLNVGNPLPVELITWNAQVLNNSAVLVNWKTGWERNNSHFIVERSINARDFEQIGVLDGKGDAQFENSYQFQDDNPSLGVNYYRLKQVDHNTDNYVGATNLISRIISVTLNNSGILTVSPNPTKDKFIVNLRNEQGFSWSVVSPEGVILQSNGKGKSIDISNYPIGIYLIRVESADGTVYTEKVIKE